MEWLFQFIVQAWATFVEFAYRKGVVAGVAATLSPVFTVALLIFLVRLGW
jgi:hypothetical protein